MGVQVKECTLIYLDFIAKLSCSRPVHIQNTSRTSENEPHEGALKFDKDGDLVVQNRTKDEVLEELFVYIGELYIRKSLKFNKTLYISVSDGYFS